RDHVSAEPHTWHEYRGSAYHQGSALHPIIELIERAVMITDADTPDDRVAKLARGLGYSGFPSDEVLLLVADLFGLPTPEGVTPLALSPEAKRKKTLDALVVWPVALSQRQPMIIVAENLHWWDASTLEAAGMLIEQAPAVSMLIILTFRPEFEPPWPGSSRWMHLPLQPLAQKHIEAIASHIAGGKPLPLKVRKQIVAKTDGVPLFVEELTKSVLESDLLVESDERHERTDPLPSLAIPATLRDSLTARLDRLGPAKEVAQLGSVLGREFSYEVLRLVSTHDAAGLDHALQELVDAGLIFQRGFPPKASYVFKHALIQDAASQSLLEKRRRECHALVAEVLEQHFPEQVDLAPELLARHYEFAGLPKRAIPLYQRAGEAAMMRSANAEAIGSLMKAIELLAALPGGRERDESELVLQLSLGVPLVALKGWGSREAEELHQRALDLCEAVGDASQLARALFGLHTVYTTRSDLEAAAALAQRSLRLADREGDASLRATTSYALGCAAYWQGKVSESLEHLDEAITLDDSSLPSSYPSIDGTRPAIVARIWSGLALWLRGYPEQALRRSLEAIELARSAGHPFSFAYALAWCASLHFMRRERDPARERATEAMAVAE
ncbi:MAG: hypothetical protein GY946_10160, partial [bacterium]|nr:hypothetical protein [bacterium]